MTKTEAIRHFKSQSALAAALGISQSAVSMWDEELPPLRQFQLHHASGGALAVDAEYLPPLARPAATPATPAEAA